MGQETPFPLPDFLKLFLQLFEQKLYFVLLIYLIYWGLSISFPHQSHTSFFSFLKNENKPILFLILIKQFYCYLRFFFPFHSFQQFLFYIIFFYIFFMLLTILNASPKISMENEKAKIVSHSFILRAVV